MKPGIYEDVEATRLAEAEYWAMHGFRFGSWQFLPETGEVRRNGLALYQLSPNIADYLTELIQAYPAYLPGDTNDSLKMAVKRLRQRLGESAILTTHSWGYRFNPEAVM